MTRHPFLAWNRITDFSGGGEGRERLTKEHINIIHGHRQQHGEGLGLGGGWEEGDKKEESERHLSIINKIKVKNINSFIIYEHNPFSHGVHFYSAFS